MRNTTCRGVKVILKMTAAGTGSVVLKIQGKNPADGSYYDILTGSAVASITTNIYTVSPSIPVVANTTAADVIPEYWRVTCSGNGNATTYTVGFSMLP